MTTSGTLQVLDHLERTFGAEPFTFADARRHWILNSAGTLAGLRGTGYVRRLTSRRQGGSDPSRTLWVVTPAGAAKARWWRGRS